MLYAHPKVHPDPARIRFVGFGAYSLDLEIFAYVRATDYGEFLAVQEDVYLRIMDIVAASGTGFAVPSQPTYFPRARRGRAAARPPPRRRTRRAPSAPATRPARRPACCACPAPAGAAGRCAGSRTSSGRSHRAARPPGGG